MEIERDCVECSTPCIVGVNATYVYRSGDNMSVICDRCSGEKRDENGYLVSLLDENSQARASRWIAIIVCSIIVGVVLFYLIH